jgi:hypothetical protein
MGKERPSTSLELYPAAPVGGGDMGRWVEEGRRVAAAEGSGGPIAFKGGKRGRRLESFYVLVTTWSVSLSG